MLVLYYMQEHQIKVDMHLYVTDTRLMVISISIGAGAV